MEQIKIQSYYYIIKVQTSSEVMYKIGETLRDQTRPTKLIEKYQRLRNITATQIAFEKLPDNGERRLNDKNIHKHLSQLQRVHPDHMFRVLGAEEDGINEFFYAQGKSDAAVVEYVADVVATLAETAEYFTAKVSYINNITLHYNKQKHRVPSETIDAINSFAHLKLNREADKNILLIGQFDPDWVATFALENHVAILHDDACQKHTYSYKLLNNKIVYLNDMKGVFDMNIKFDYVIANPPYAVGNEITSAIIDNVAFERYINLMPKTRYDGRELYRYVEDVEEVNDTFEDAKIGKKLSVAVITKSPADVFLSYNDFKLRLVEECFMDYYRLNMKCKQTFISIAHPDLCERFNPQIDMQIPHTSIMDGVHSSGRDVDWNLHGDVTSFPIDKSKNSYGCIFYRFSTENEKNNFSQFWYNNPLMNLLIKGLHSDRGVITIAVPNIDWSKERDYEHLTLDDIMNILREENPNVTI